MKLKLRKDDLVEVVAGNERFRPSRAGEEGAKSGPVRGRIIEVDRKKGLVVVEGVNLRKRHIKVRQDQSGYTGGIEEHESPIHVSNVRLVDPKTDKPVRVGVKEVDGKRVRYTKGRNASGTTLDDQA